jgi:serpin B
MPLGPSLQIPDADRSEVGRSNVAFALDLYQALLQSQSGGSQNLVYSPYSIQVALSMTYAGARGNTEQELARALHVALPQERLHPALRSVEQQLAARARPPSGGDPAAPVQSTGPAPFQLRIANALWGASGATFRPEFLNVVDTSYGAGLRRADFAADPEGVRNTINQWVSDQTEQRIQNLFPEGTLDVATQLVLVNAVYFRAGWREPFAASLTQPDTFNLLDGAPVPIQMMRRAGPTSFRYAEDVDYQIVELPYLASDVTMLVLLPREGSFADFTRTLTAERLQTIIDRLQTQRVILSMPKFRLAPEGMGLVSLLQALGVNDAFDERADFSGISDDRFRISRAYHKAFVEVDEVGTEAAAATGISVLPVSAEIDLVPPKEMRVDRPFLFLIRDQATGVLLFVGSVVNPPA